MVEFTKQAVDDEAWPRICSKHSRENVVDGAGCTEAAYQNLTHFIEPFLGAITDLVI